MAVLNVLGVAVLDTLTAARALPTTGYDVVNREAHRIVAYTFTFAYH